MTLFNPGSALPSITEADADTISRDDARLLLSMRHEIVQRTVDACCMRGITPDWPPFFTLKHHREALHAQPFVVQGRIAFDPATQTLLRGITTEDQAAQAMAIIQAAHAERMKRSSLGDDFQLPERMQWRVQSDNKFYVYLSANFGTGRYGHIDFARKDDSPLLGCYGAAVARALLERQGREPLGEVATLWQEQMRSLSATLEAARDRVRKIEKLVERANAEPESKPASEVEETLAELRYRKELQRESSAGSYVDKGTGMPRRHTPAVPMQTPGR